jgi:2,3-bisphosphoglycerate-dependent phosphoglycerate mutase
VTESGRAAGSGWPERLWLARHGQSAGNVAAAQALAEGRPLIEVPDRDVDVPLSPLGRRQAVALGAWFARQLPEERPTVVMSSPYLRAADTARAIQEAARLELPAGRFIVDERLRERELGMLNRLTKQGIVARYPEQAELRARLGKFYYRPPSGESWCDVILRLRLLLGDACLRWGGERILVVAHQAVALCCRYVLEQLTEAQLLAIDAQADVANCGLTAYARDGEQMRLRFFNFVAPLEEGGAPVTRETDAPAAAR